MDEALLENRTSSKVSKVSKSPFLFCNIYTINKRLSTWSALSFLKGINKEHIVNCTKTSRISCLIDARLHVKLFWFFLAPLFFRLICVVFEENGKWPNVNAHSFNHFGARLAQDFFSQCPINNWCLKVKVVSLPKWPPSGFIYFSTTSF